MVGQGTRLAIMKDREPCQAASNEKRLANVIGAAAARGMSRPTLIVLILVGFGLSLFGLRIFGIEPLQYKWVLAISICLVAYGVYLYVIAKRPNSN